jgi:chitinase
MFLGGTAAGWPRPFGDAVIDGIDLDIEGSLAAIYGGIIGGTVTPVSIGRTPLAAEPEAVSGTGYTALTNALRSLYTSLTLNPGARRYVNTAAPACPLPNLALADALRAGWFDYLWPQFFNANCTSDSELFNFGSWWGSRGRARLGGWARRLVGGPWAACDALTPADRSLALRMSGAVPTRTIAHMHTCTPTC